MSKIKEWKESLRLKPSRRTLWEAFFVAGLLVAATFFAIFWEVLRSERMVLFFVEQREALSEWSSVADSALSLFSYVGVELFFMFFLFPIIFWIGEKDAGKKSAMSLLVAGGAVFFIRQFIDLPRPYIPEMEIATPGNSFPSGHITQSIVAIGFLAVYYKSWIISLLTAFLVFLIGVSRLLFGFHFLDELLGGVMVGLATLYIFAKSISWLEKRVDLPLLFFFTLVVVLPFFLYFAEGDAARHSFLLLYLGGLFTGFIVENRFLKLIDIKRGIEKAYKLFLGMLIFCPLLILEINRSNLIEEGFSTFVYLTYFFLGLFVSLVWPTLFASIGRVMELILKKRE